MEPKLTPEEEKRTLAVDTAGKRSMHLAGLLHGQDRHLLTQAEIADLLRLQRLLQDVCSTGADLPNHYLLAPGRLSELSQALKFRVPLTAVK